MCRQAAPAGREGGLEEDPCDFSLVCPHSRAHTRCVTPAQGFPSVFALDITHATVVASTFSSKLLPGGVSCKRVTSRRSSFHSRLRVFLISLSTRIFVSLHGECLPFFSSEPFPRNINPCSFLCWLRCPFTIITRS